MIAPVIACFSGVSIEKGVLGQLWGAVSGEVVSGEYYGPGGGGGEGVGVDGGWGVGGEVVGVDGEGVEGLGYVGWMGCELGVYGSFY